MQTSTATPTTTGNTNTPISTPVLTKAQTPDLFHASTISTLVNRIEQLQPSSQALWGKMNVAQMLRHGSDTTQISFGEKQLKRPFIARLIGPLLLKKSIKDNTPSDKNLPTHPNLVLPDASDFETEKNNLIALIQQFLQKDKSEFEGRIHPFFGKMTAEEWNILSYKHLDHHLRQFGV